MKQKNKKVFFTYLLIVSFFTFVYSDLSVKWYINYFNGIDYIKKGEYQKAKECLEDALAQKGKPKKSTTFYSKVRGPYIPYYYLAKVYFYLGKYEVAKSKLEMSEKFKIAPKIESDFYDLKSKIEKKLREEKSGKLDKSIVFYQKGLLSFTSGKYEDAIKWLDKAISEKGKDSENAKNLKKKILEKIKFQKKLESDYLMAKNLYDSGRYEDACSLLLNINERKSFYRDVPVLIEKCKRAIEIKGKLKNLKSEILSGNNLEKDKMELEDLKKDGYFLTEIDSLLEILNRKLKEKSIEERKKELQNLFEEGKRLYKSGNLNRAREIFIKISLNNLSSQDLKNKSLKFVSQIDLKLKEIKKLSNLIDQAKKLLKGGKYDESEKVLKEALKISPGNKNVLDLLTLVNQFRQTGGKNEEKLKSVLKNGILLYFKGDYRDAINTLNNYLNLSNKKRELAKFFIGASYISIAFSSSLKEREKYLENGREIFRKLKKDGFTLKRDIGSYISPKILSYFNNAN